MQDLASNGPLTASDDLAVPPPPATAALDLAIPLEVRTLPALGRPLQPVVREVGLLLRPPWVRTLGKLAIDVPTQGWRFPTPDEPTASLQIVDPDPAAANKSADRPCRHGHATHVKPPGDMVMFKDRLLYLLQPPLENLFTSKQVDLPFQPYPYQIKGIAFLMPRHAALLADEMGLGKTAQVIVALRLLFNGGLNTASGWWSAPSRSWRTGRASCTRGRKACRSR